MECDQAHPWQSDPDVVQHCLTHSYCKRAVSEWVTRVIEPKGCRWFGLWWKSCQVKFLGKQKSVLFSTPSSVRDGTKNPNGPVGDAQRLEAKKGKGCLCSWTNTCWNCLPFSSGHSCSPCSHSVADTPLWYDAISGVLAVQTSQQTLDLDDQRAINLPTTHMLQHTGPTVHTQNDSSLCKTGTAQVPLWAVSICQYLYSLCSTWPHVQLTSACPHILILFGMCCQATVSVNTAPGSRTGNLRSSVEN